jgi:hypothetical protein
MRFPVTKKELGRRDVNSVQRFKIRTSELPSKVNQEQAQDPYSASTSQRYGLQICIELKTSRLSVLLKNPDSNKP